MKSKKKTDRIFYTFCYIILLAVAVIMIVPFLWMILSTFKPLHELYQFPPTFLPKNFTFENYKEVFTTVPFFKYYINSFIVNICSVALTLFTSSTAGFAFAKYHFKGRNARSRALIGDPGRETARSPVKLPTRRRRRWPEVRAGG